jgi:hypothetical protein
MNKIFEEITNTREKQLIDEAKQLYTQIEKHEKAAG